MPTLPYLFLFVPRQTSVFFSRSSHYKTRTQLYNVDRYRSTNHLTRLPKLRRYLRLVGQVSLTSSLRELWVQSGLDFGANCTQRKSALEGTTGFSLVLFRLSDSLRESDHPKSFNCPCSSKLNLICRWGLWFWRGPVVMYSWKDPVHVLINK